MRSPPTLRRLVVAFLVGGAVALCSALPATAIDLTPGDRVSDSPYRSFGDINGNGLLDMADDGVSYRLQSPAGVFGDKVHVLNHPSLGGDPWVVLADLTGDPRAEVALFGSKDQIAFGQLIDTAALPEDQRTWSFASTGLGDHEVSPFTTGDVTGDGRIDAVAPVRDGDGPKILVARNDGSGHPSIQVSPVLPGSAQWGLDLADVTGDGVLDIVVGRDQGIGYLSDRGGVLTGWTPLPGLNIPDLRALAIGQFNADGVPDVVLVRGPFDAPRFALLISRVSGGQTTYQEVPPPAVPIGDPCSVATGELNGDGKADIALLGCKDPTSIPLLGRTITLLGDGTGGFGQSGVVVPDASSHAWPVGVEIVDLDGDGLGEILLAEADSAAVVYMNRTVVEPRPHPSLPSPSPPTTAGTDRTPPKTTLKVATKRWALGRPLVVNVKCNEKCTATLGIQLSFARGKRVVRAIPLDAKPRLTLSQGKLATVTIRLHRARRLTAAGLLKSGLRGTARISIRAVDASGNVRTIRKTIRLTL